MKNNLLNVRQIRNSVEAGGNEYTIQGKVKSILIANLASSQQTMWCGLNEDASDKLPIEPGGFLALSKDDGTFYSGNVLRFRFAASHMSNKGYMLLETEVSDTDEEICN